MKKYLPLIFFAATLSAQETRGSMTGRVSDPSGAVIAGVKIIAQSASTRIKTETRTNNEGIYQLPYLLPGNYRVSAENQGFKTQVRDRIELRINDRLELNFEMEIGSVGDRVEVVAETPLLQTSTASMGQVVDHKRIAELPLLHGNPMAVLELTPGIAQARTSDLGLWGGRVFDNGWTTSFAIDGAGSNTHEVTLDGASNTTRLGGAGGGRNTVAYTPPADLVEELKVQTASFDASVGYTSGAVINMSVRSGTRDLHGTAYYFKVLPELNANQWFANRSGQPKVDFSYNRWGGSNTGPIVIPKVYNGREKTFYSYGYEGHHDSPPWPITYTVPRPNQLNGDFSDLLKVGSNYQIFDPSSARLLANGRVQRDPFAGNIIPASRINAFTKPITKYWGAPRVNGADDGTNNFPDPAQPDPNLYFSHVARVDHNISNRNRLYGRLGVSKNIEKNYRDAFLNESTGNNLVRRNRGITIDDVHTFSPHFILDVRYGYARFREDSQPKSLGFDMTSVGFDKGLAAQIDPQSYVFPCFAAAGYASLGCNNPSKNATDNHDLNVGVDSLRGSHTMKYGGVVRVYRKTAYPFGQAVPRLDFGTNFTKGPFDNSPASPLGQGLASFLLGIPTGGYVDRNASYAEQSKGYALYLQDDWKVSRTFTLTLGLRYEYEGPLTERHNRSVAGFDFTARSPIEAAAKANYARGPIAEIPVDRFAAPGGLVFAGSGNRALYSADSNNFMPRIGIVWAVRPKTVIRSGYGVFFGNLGVRRGDVIQSGFSQRTDIIPTLDNGLTFRVPNLGNPFVDGILAVPGASQGLSTFLGRGVSFFNQKPLTPYMQRYQISVQHEAPGRVLLDLAYVGNRGTHLEFSRDIGAYPLSYLSRSPVRDSATIDFLSANVPNPFYPLLPGTGLAQTTTSRAQLLSPYPHFTGTSTTSSDGFSWYHSLQIKAERRFSRGFTFTTGYTFSKFMEATSLLNAADLYPERVISAQDFPHRFSVSGIWELPFGNGRRLLGSARGIGGHIVSGWQAQGVYTGQSGQALGFGNSIFNGDLRAIPLPKSQRTPDRWFNTGAGFETNSARQLAFNYRALNSRFNGIRGDGINQFNLSLIKNTRITESKTFQFRAEAINAMNHVQFTNPNTSPSNRAFGTVTDEKSTGRAIQLGFKFLF